MNKEKVIEICEGLVGTVMTTFENDFEVRFEREPTAEEIAYAEIYMTEQGIMECACCGWWHSDMGGLDGNLCSDCEDEEDEEF